MYVGPTWRFRFLIRDCPATRDPATRDFDPSLAMTEEVFAMTMGMPPMTKYCILDPCQTHSRKRPKLSIRP